jgi:beta-glucosidase
MGSEFHDKGSNIQLEPGVCIARVPVGGRNFEYVSGEDPFIGYTIKQPVFCGIHSVGIMANAKHFLDNDQEADRRNVSAVVDARTQHQHYLPPCEGVVEAGAVEAGLRPGRGRGESKVP